MTEGEGRKENDGEGVREDREDGEGEREREIGGEGNDDSLSRGNGGINGERPKEECEQTKGNKRKTG